MIQAGILLTVLCNIPLGQSTDLIATTGQYLKNPQTGVVLVYKLTVISDTYYFVFISLVICLK